ncbi:MAG: hypothetical protein RLZZ244_1643 [Verrucomicrobiota bacterium]|jgi:hypothetical protein
MTHTSNTLRFLGSASLAVLSLVSTALAGSKAEPAPKKEESGALFKKLNATLETGYDSAYYFRGLWFSNNNAWSSLNISVPVTEKLSLGFGSVYTSSTLTNAPLNGGLAKLNYSELDLISSATYDAGFAKFGLIYTYYNFFDTFSGSAGGATYGNVDPDSTITSAQDLGLTVSKSFGPFNVSAGAWHDFKISARYFEATTDCPVKINSWLSLVPAVAVGYGQGSYYSYVTADPASKSSGFTNVRTTLSAPMQLTETAVFTPYIAGNFSGATRYVSRGSATALNTVEGRNDFYFGAKLGISF